MGETAAAPHDWKMVTTGKCHCAAAAGAAALSACGAAAASPPCCCAAAAVGCSPCCCLGGLEAWRRPRRRWLLVVPLPLLLVAATTASAAAASAAVSPPASAWLQFSSTAARAGATCAAAAASLPACPLPPPLLPLPLLLGLAPGLAPPPAGRLKGAASARSTVAGRWASLVRRSSTGWRNRCCRGSAGPGEGWETGLTQRRQALGTREKGGQAGVPHGIAKREPASQSCARFGWFASPAAAAHPPAPAVAGTPHTAGRGCAGRGEGKQCREGCLLANK